MRTRMRRVAATAVVLGLLAVLSACAFVPQPVVTVLPTDGTASSAPTATPAPRPTATTVTIAPTAVPTTSPQEPADGSDCGGRAVTLTDGSESLVLSGSCPEVKVQGADLVVDLTAADVGTLTLSGDRLAVSAGVVGTLTVRGNDLEVTAVSINRVEVQGDRNAISASEVVGSVQFDGNDNTLRSGSAVGGVVDNGGRNTIQ